jgi:holliday junction DNA helicase RuvA
MIAHLEGTIRYKSPDYLIVDVHGVGYCVHVPLSTFYDLPDTGQNAALNIHTHVREDALQLYGFRTLAEKEMFLHLITVTGIGPRLAVNILSGISPEELRQVVYQENRHRLQSIPGVGRKIAERIIFELRDKLKLQPQEDISGTTAPLLSGEGAETDAFSALLNLGYRPAEAERALRQAKSGEGENLPLADLLKGALRLLAQRL